VIDIRLETGLIIRKGSEFLVGRCVATGNLKWSDSPWDAWRTRIRADARTVAERIDGEILLFNPIAGQMKEFRNGKVV
jgi:hypothetical protein